LRGGEVLQPRRAHQRPRPAARLAPRLERPDASAAAVATGSRRRGRPAPEGALASGDRRGPERGAGGGRGSDPTPQGIVPLPRRTPPRELQPRPEAGLDRSAHPEPVMNSPAQSRLLPIKQGLDRVLAAIVSTLLAALVIDVVW